MDMLRVRAYNVRFGDAILIAVPDRDAAGQTTTRHILIDVGNATSTAGGVNTVFKPAVEDILRVLDGRPLDLYVMTHEHMDHVQGLLYAAEKVYTRDDLAARLRPHDAWFTASAHPRYYETHPEAKKQLDAARALMDDIRLYLKAAPAVERERAAGLLSINDSASTSKCVDYLRELAGPEHSWYVHRETDLAGKHPFREARFEIWAPEENTAVYYGKQPRIALGVTPGATPRSKPALTAATPPPGVDAGAFYDLAEMRRSSYLDNLLAIDKAANDTSVVFCLSWRGWRLLFPGDAEHLSWNVQARNQVVGPVNLLKVSHHASANGTPGPELLGKLLPEDGAPHLALVSTYANTYPGVPDDDTLARLGARSGLHIVPHDPDGTWLEMAFEEGGRDWGVTYADQSAPRVR
jgi:beta-lactamase superfamily II metal-dependent hydrolase